jgi:hypothetical protein
MTILIKLEKVKIIGPDYTSTRAKRHFTHPLFFSFKKPGYKMQLKTRIRSPLNFLITPSTLLKRIDQKNLWTPLTGAPTSVRLCLFTALS